MIYYIIIYIYVYIHMGVSPNGGTSKRMVYRGKSILFGMIWGYPYDSGNLHICTWWSIVKYIYIIKQMEEY